MTNLDREIWRVALSSQFSEEDLAKLDDFPHSEEFVSAVYTTIRTYQRSSGTAKYLNLSDHIKRLTNSLLIENISWTIHPEVLKSALKEAEKRSAFPGELRIKIIVVPYPKPYSYLVFESLTTPGLESYTEGLDVVTTQYVRNAPEVKAYAFVKKQEEIRSQINSQIEEVLMVNTEGEILEGLSSNFFGVIDSKIFTAEKQVLEGITRKIVIHLILDRGFPLLFKPIRASQLDELTECFITSTSRGILPVRKINQKVIGYGKPGAITQELSNLYSNKILELIEPI